MTCFPYTFCLCGSSLGQRGTQANKKWEEAGRRVGGLFAPLGMGLIWSEFGRNWSDSVRIWSELVRIWSELVRFGQNLV